MASSIQNFDLEYLTSAIADQVKARLATKQDTLQLDASPTQNSAKFVNSGSVYAAIAAALAEGKKIFVGTTADWNALTTAEKEEYDGGLVVLTDDGIGDGGGSGSGGGALFIDEDGYICVDYESVSTPPPVTRTINITTSDSSLYGKTVTATYGEDTETVTISQSGTATIEITGYKGEVSLSASNGVGTASATVTLVSGTDTYSVTLTATVTYTINISTTDSSLYGKTVTASYGDSQTATGTFSNSGAATIEITDYTGEVSLSASDGSKTATTTVMIVSGTISYSATLSIPAIYGVSWDGGSSSAMTRTDDSALFADPSPAVSNGNGSSPFDNLYPWNGMEIVNDADAGALVSIPKYYYKWTKTGSAMTLQIADKPTEGYHTSPAHADRGDGNGERDVVYVSRYHCSSTNYKSTTGVTPKVSITRDAARQAIHNLGTDIWQYDFAMYWTIMMLYLVEYADWNSQKKIGYGCAPTGNTSAVRNVGYTDAMTYHTGTDQASRTTYGGTQYRHIEGLWDNCYDWCDGIRFSGADVLIINTPSNFSDSTGGTKVGERATTSNDIKSFFVPSASGLEWALYPNEVISDSNYETYVCDRCNYSASGVVLCVGGYYGQYQYLGAFYLYGNYDASSSYQYIGARLQKLPTTSSNS